jgi:hypothetical protein
MYNRHQRSAGFRPEGALHISPGQRPGKVDTKVIVRPERAMQNVLFRCPYRAILICEVSISQGVALGYYV